MKPNQPSETAQRAAMRRAAHQLLDHPNVFDDPLALRIVGGEAAAQLRADPEPYQKPLRRLLRAFLAVRSRVAEDALAEAVQRGVAQLVILGAGLDTFAYRNPFGAQLRVYEVDHPSTQAWKRDRLGEAGIAIPDSLAFCPINFESDTLGAALARAGFDTRRPAFFSWLGVVPYLTRTAVTETLRFVASGAPGSEVIFDFSPDPAVLTERQRLVFDAMAAVVAEKGEPFQSFFEPEALKAEVRGLGFSRVDVVTPNELNAAHFAGRTDGLRVGSLGHLLRALV